MKNLLSNMKRTAALCLAAVLLTLTIAGCSDSVGTSTSVEGTAQVTITDSSGNQSTDDSTAATADTANTAIDAAGLDLEFTANDLDTGYDEKNDTLITADAGTVSVTGSGSAGVSVNGSIITIMQEGTYILSGVIADGQVIVSADAAKVHLVFNGIKVHCDDNAPVYIESADKVFITLAQGTENTLTDGISYISDDAEVTVDGVIFSKADLTMNGTGSLTIEGNYKNGIVSKDDLVFTGGTYNISAAGQAISGKDCVKIKAGTFNLVTGGDGIQSDNTEDASLGYIYIEDGTFTVAAETDAIQAQTVLQIDGGTYQVTTGGGSSNASTTSSGQDNQNWGKGGAAVNTSTAATTDTAAAASSDTVSSAKGLKALGELIVNGGDFIIDSSDDALHSNEDLTINNGTFNISSGDDGMHADSNLSILGGSVTITKSYEGIEGYNITVSDGTVSLTASDDGFNVAGGADSSSVNGRSGQNTFTTVSSDMALTISGGTITVNAGGDGLDSNGNLYIEGGFITVSGPEDNGNGTIDYNGTGTISGGILLGSGSSGMMEVPGSESTQASLSYSLSSTYQAGTAISLADESGKVIASWTAEKTFSSVVISTPDMVTGASYVLTVGSDSQTIELTSVATSNGSSEMGGGTGGAMGGKR